MIGADLRTVTTVLSYMSYSSYSSYRPAECAVGHWHTRPRCPHRLYAVLPWGRCLYFFSAFRRALWMLIHVRLMMYSKSSSVAGRSTMYVSGMVKALCGNSRSGLESR